MTEPVIVPTDWGCESAMSSDMAHVRYITANLGEKRGIMASVRFREEIGQSASIAVADCMARAHDLRDALELAEKRLVLLSPPGYVAPELDGIRATIAAAKGEPRRLGAVLTPSSLIEALQAQVDVLEKTIVNIATRDTGSTNDAEHDVLNDCIAEAQGAMLTLKKLRGRA